MTLVTRCHSNFSSTSRVRGKRIYSLDCVEELQIGSHGATAVVRDKRGSHDVELSWEEDEATVECACSCPIFDEGQFCEHIFAMLTAVDIKGAPSVLAGIGPAVRLRRMKNDDVTEVETAETWSETAARMLGLLGKRSPRAALEAQGPDKSAAAKHNWRRQLSEAANHHYSLHLAQRLESVDSNRRRETWFVIDIAESMHEKELVIGAAQRETRKNTDRFGKLKGVRLGHLSANPLHFNADEKPALDALVLCGDHHYSYSSRSFRDSFVKLSPPGYEIALPRLAASGRLAWEMSIDAFDADRPKRVSWDDGPAWEFSLRIDADDATKQWIIRGELSRPATGETMLLEKPALLLSSGLILAEGRLSRLDAGLGFAWIVLLRRDREVRVPFSAQSELIEQLWRSVTGLKLACPDELRCEEVKFPPQGKVRVVKPKESWLRGRLMARVTFHYEGHEVTPTSEADTIVDAQRRRVMLRDRSAEIQALAQLQSCGLRRSYYMSSGNDYEVDPQELPKFVERATAYGWNVEAEGQSVRRLSHQKLNVTSGVDWFELNGTFDFDGQKVELPALLAAVRKGEKFVTLGDGSRGLLPEEWLKRLGLLTDLGGDVKAGEAPRFRRAQALLLDALLADQPAVDIDRQFAAAREKLLAFQGVKPRTPPAGFQGDLRDYQQAGLGWLHFLQEFGFGGCLADDMGLGKTVQVLALLESRRIRRMLSGQARSPSLVVVPRSLVFNWMEEARRFAPKLRFLNLTGIERKERWEQLGEHDVAITTYGTLRQDIARLKDVPFDYVILDESQAIKNANSQSSKACRLLQADHRVAMTGTPIENHLGELWSLFDFLNPGMLGRSSAFSQLADSSDRQGRGVLARAVAPLMLRRTKGQVLSELPAKTEQTIYCELSPRERKQYDDLRNYYRVLLTGKIDKQGLAKSKIHVLESLLRLRQVSCHPGLVDEQQKSEGSAKLDTLLEQLDEVLAEGHKALVFSQFTSLLDIVRKRLDRQKITYEYLDGQTRDRQQRVDRFQKDAKCPVFLISLKAGGCGLNLTAADYVFILDPWWNPAVESQAIDRAHRIGQQRPVMAYRLIARDTVEEKILELQASKRELADAIVQADDSLIRRLSVEDLQQLLS